MYYFIVNPSSRSGRGLEVWKKAEAILEQEGTEYRVYFTRERYHATDLAREITSRPEKLTLVTVGGDGTVGEVLQGIQDFSRVAFGYIPTGSSNDFARALHLPTDPEEAVKLILHPTYFRQIDIGEIDLGDRSQCFAVSTGCGFDAAVCHASLSSKGKRLLNKLHLGKLIYGANAIRLLLQRKPSDLTLTLDGKRTLTFPKTWFAACMNGRYEGGGFMMTPKARMDDGLLDVIVVHRLPRALILLVLPTAFRGWHVIFPGVKIYRAHSVEMRSADKLPVHTDGEAYFLNGKAQVNCLPGVLTIIAAKNH